MRGNASWTPQRLAQKRARARAGKTKKEQAYFIWKHRHLIVTRPENLSGRERRWLSQMFHSLPALRILRRFVRAVYRLFDPDQSPHQARCRRAALVKTTEFLADPDLAQALAMLTPVVRFIVLAIDRWYRQHGQRRAKPKVICKVQHKPLASDKDGRRQQAA